FDGGGSNVGTAIAYSVGLTADIDEVSVAAGGTQNLFLNAGEEFGGQFYLVAFSQVLAPLSLGLGVTLPIRFDAFFSLSLSAANTPPFVNNFGVLNPDGQGAAALALPPGAASGLVGTTLNSAFVSFDLAATPLFASNAVDLDFLP
ncbi:MAG: hypothetical protein AAFZ65_20950, partial [Planctomycetota bacterium]